MVPILVLLTIVGFLLADWIVQLMQVRRARISLAKAGFTTMPASGSVSEVMDRDAAASTIVGDGISEETDEEFDPYPPPRGLFFHRGHCWAQIETMGMWRVGMDGMISQLVGRIDEIYLPTHGMQVHEGDTLASVRQGSHILALKSPVEGEVIEVNGNLRPKLLRTRSYTDGWLCVIQPKALAADARRLVVGDDVVRWHKREFQRLANFFSELPKLGSRLVYDSHTGAPILGAVMEKASESDWQRFQELFLVGRN